MYDNAEEAITSILAIVDKCPDQFKDKCFEVLLKGYVDSHLAVTLPRPPSGGIQIQQPPIGLQQSPSSLVPTTMLPRLQTTAKRLGVLAAQIEALFDFTKDPFGFHAIAVRGENKADAVRKVALVVAFKSYLATGTWLADWKEVQAMAVDQNCYDRKNHATFLRNGPNLFKAIEAGKNIELTSDGIKEAEKLVTTLAKGDQQ